VKKVVITGSNGFIGSRLSMHYTSSGYRVYGIDRPAMMNRSLQRIPELSYYPMNLPDPLLENLLDEWQPDLLIHTAGSSSVPFSVLNPLGDFNGSVQLFYHVLDTVRRAIPSCIIIFLSSAAVYGNPIKLPVSEHDLICPVSPYGYHKFLCEKISEEFCKLYQLKVCSIRIFSAYGPGLMRQVLWDICNKAINDPVVSLFGTGKETRDFIHVADIAQAIHLVGSNASFLSESYNIASGIETPIAELASLVVDAIGNSKEIVFTREKRTGDPLRWKADIRKISDLGYSPKVDLKSGVQEYVKWALPHIERAHETRKTISVSMRANKRNTKIILVGPLPPPYGGIPSYVQDLKNAQIKDIQFMTFNTAFPEWVAPFNREGEMSYTSIFESGLWGAVKKMLYVLLSYPALLMEIIRKRPDIVQVFTCSYWGYWRNWLYVLISKLCGRKTIFHLLNAIDVFYDSVSRFGKWWIGKSLNSADVYLLQSPGLKAWVDQYSHKESYGLWNGIDFGACPSAIYGDDHSTNNKAPMGITVGGLGKNKGTQDILDALHDLQLEGVKLRWIFVGGGDVEKFRAMAETRGIAESVFFTGRVGESPKMQYLQGSSFYCLPSYAEGQPISIIEAMANGLPVISTNVGSIPEMIENNISGFLIQPGDLDGLKTAIRDLASNEELRRRMGKQARITAFRRHQNAKLHSSLKEIYQKLAKVSKE
jgi:UDP-glucose 4-epimerase